MSRFTPEDQGEEEKREVEINIQHELVTPEKTKTQTREEVIQSRVKTEEVQQEQQEQVTADYRRLQPVVLEQRAAEPQLDKEDDWFVVLDGSPKRSGTHTIVTELAMTQSKVNLSNRKRNLLIRKETAVLD